MQSDNQKDIEVDLSGQFGKVRKLTDATPGS